LREPKRNLGPRKAHSLKAMLTDFRIPARALLRLNLTAALTAMAIYSLQAWGPTFLMRSFAWSAAAAGKVFGLIVIGAGLCGVIVGGFLSDLAVARGFKNGRLIVMTAASALGVPCTIALSLAKDVRGSVAWLILTMLFLTCSLGILPSAQQALVESRLRGMTAAFGVLTVNLIGLGLGPTAIALITDYGFHDPLMLRYSLAVALPLMLLVSAVVGISALRSYKLAAAAVPA
jgi:MFS family permease